MSQWLFRRRSNRIVPFLLACAVTLTNVVAAAEVPIVPHPIVPGFERFHAAADADAVEGGRLLLGELNCTSCHAADESVQAALVTKQAPILDDVAKRIRLEHLRAFIADPQHVKPGTTMPALFAGFSEVDRQSQVERLVQFLSTTGSLTNARVDPKLVATGGKLFHQVGCTACHAPQDGTVLDGVASVPLGTLHEKYTVPSLIEFLENPHRVRPSGRMPAPRLDKNEARDVAHFLLRDAADEIFTGRFDRPKIPYAYYEGAFTSVPDFSKLKPKATGLGAAFDTALAKRNGDFALEFTAFFHIAEKGKYDFELTSDDGSKLWIDGQLVVDNDGVHAPQAKSAEVNLKEGPHRLVVAVFNSGGGSELDVKIGVPGQGWRPLAPELAPTPEALAAKKPESPAPADPNAPKPFVFDPELAKQGRELFASVGCANCHDLKRDGKPIQPDEIASIRFRPLAELKPTAGCLANPAAKSSPGYSLNASQRNALAASIGSIEKLQAPATPQENIARTMTTFNCYACHARGKVGGVEEARNPLFLTTQKEMGDEGRIPPPLDGVGAKLQTAYLKKLLDEGLTDRPYMLARMPKFGAKNVGHLVEAFEQADPPETAPAVTFDESPRRVKEYGRYMAGDKVFSCVKCHNFQKYAATGVQSIDMTILTARLKHDWFRNYMLNPQKYRPGTRMPAAWPLGQSTLTEVFDADANKQVEAIWSYLADGSKAAVPDGIIRSAIVVGPQNGEAATYRNFIQGGGTRGIGIAYPEGINIVWDAGDMRLAMIWQGQFLDASLHWQGRGGGFQTPLGSQPVTLAPGPSVAVLDSASAEWPEKPGRDMGYRFQGYRYTKDRRPTFRYEFADVTVEDFPTGLKTGDFPTLKRTVTISAKESVPGLTFRAARAKSIEKQPDGTYRLTGDVLLKLDSPVPPSLVESNGEQELRVPIQSGGEPVAVTLEYSW